MLKLIPEGIPEKTLFAETQAFWEGADERLGQCARCPTHGGACASSHSAIPDGRTIARAPGGGAIVVEPCARYAVYERRQALARTGVPPQLLSADLSTVLATASMQVRDKITRYVAELPTQETDRWLVLSGGGVMQRTRLLVAVLRAVLEQHHQRCNYDYAPALFKKMIAHMNEKEAPPPNPLVEIRESWFFALDFVDRTKGGWSDWYTREIDDLFFSRWGQPMAIGTPLTLDQLRRDFNQSGPCFEDAVVVDASGVGR